MQAWEWHTSCWGCQVKGACQKPLELPFLQLLLQLCQKLGDLLHPQGEMRAGWEALGGQGQEAAPVLVAVDAAVRIHPRRLVA